MADTINVFLITGFLGSGKTTFLNRLVQQFPENLKLMILMNEFGEIGVDGALVPGEDLEILEINKGSIFCACVKTDFIKGLYEITQKIKPDILLIESTGVANPSDLKKDLDLPIFKGCFALKEQFCMVDAASFLDEFGVFASVENQIASSTRFIINKTDLAPREQVERIKALIRDYHPDPCFYETTYASVDVAGLLSLKGDPGREKGGGPVPMTEEDLDRYVEDLISGSGASVTPPDILMSATFCWRGGSLAEIESMSGELPGEVVRAKGFLADGAGTYLYSCVMGRSSMEKMDRRLRESRMNVLVFIAPPEVMPGVEAVMQKYNFIKLGDLTPGLAVK